MNGVEQKKKIEEEVGYSRRLSCVVGGGGKVYNRPFVESASSPRSLFLKGFRAEKKVK